MLTHSIEKPTWLEEIVSESNTIQAQEFLLGQEDWSFKPDETICKNWSVFIDNFGLTNSFGLGLFVELEFIIPDQGIQVRSLGKSIRESSRWVKVILHVIR